MGLSFLLELLISSHIQFDMWPYPPLQPQSTHSASTFATCSFLSLYLGCPSPHHLKNSYSLSTTKLPWHLLQAAFLEFPTSVLLMLKPVFVPIVILTIYPSLQIDGKYYELMTITASLSFTHPVCGTLSLLLCIYSTNE